MTSKKLMSYCEYKGVVHIDGTYKSIINNFPVVVIGKTDIQGKFFPIAFFITSHETSYDIGFFYKSLKETAKILGTELEPEQIIQDAHKGSWNAADEYFDCPILMSYFHIKQALTRNRCKMQSKDDDKWEDFMTDMSFDKNLLEIAKIVDPYSNINDQNRLPK